VDLTCAAADRMSTLAPQEVQTASLVDPWSSTTFLLPAIW